MVATGEQLAASATNSDHDHHSRAVFWASIRLIAVSTPVAAVAVLAEGRDPVVVPARHVAGVVLVGLILLAMVLPVTTPRGRRMLAGRGKRPNWVKKQLRPGFGAFSGLVTAAWLGLFAGIKIIHHGDAGDVGVVCWALVLIVAFTDVAWSRLKAGSGALLHVVTIVGGYVFVGLVCVLVLIPLGSTRIAFHRSCLAAGQSRPTCLTKG